MPYMLWIKIYAIFIYIHIADILSGNFLNKMNRVGNRNMQKTGEPCPLSAI